jgi:predicted membrane protein
MGGAEVDLRDALVEGQEIEIVACALFGTVHVIIPSGIPVDVAGFMVMGTRRNDVAAARALEAGPRVRVLGYGAFGTIKVQSERLS